LVYVRLSLVTAMLHALYIYFQRRKKDFPLFWIELGFV
jgi:hypothetical protein